MIEVKYFGKVVEKTYCQTEKFTFSELPLHLLIEAIEQKYQFDALPFRIAINKKIIQNAQKYILKSDDVVAILPPFAGG